MGPDRDYKYFIDELSKLYIGARYTYGEVLDETDLSARFRQIVSRIFLQHVDPETTIESHLYFLQDDTEDYRALSRIRARARCSVLTEKKRFGGGTERVYREKVFTMGELVSFSPAEKEARGFVIRELIISKPALLSFVV